MLEAWARYCLTPAAGGNVDVPTPTGILSLHIPPGTSSGRERQKDRPSRLSAIQSPLGTRAPDVVIRGRKVVGGRPNLLRETERLRAAGAALVDKRVVIDPGHGGAETGAIGPGGLQEKEATLQIAKRLVATLPKEYDLIPCLDLEAGAPSSEKGAWFVNMCDRFGLPLAVLSSLA